MRRLYYSIKALTPLHVGVGTGLGHIDLPIQREVHTKFPMIPGSAVKGALREHKLREIVRKMEDFPDNLKGKIMEILDECLASCGDKDRCSEIEVKYNDKRINLKELTQEIVDYFGCQNQAGRLAFSDLRILLFPVKSLNGIFAYVTSPQVLERLAEDLGVYNWVKCNIEKSELENLKDEKCLVFKNSLNRIDGSNNRKIVVLEEFSFDVEDIHDKISCVMEDLFYRLGLKNDYELIKRRIVIVSDNAFNDFVQNYTEVQTHVKIDPSTGTVQTGALWTEEYLPAETYMYGIIFETRNANNSQNDLLDNILPDYLHLGGDITTGKGFVKINRGAVLDNQEEKNVLQNA